MTDQRIILRLEVLNCFLGLRAELEIDLKASLIVLIQEELKKTDETTFSSGLQERKIGSDILFISEDGLIVIRIVVSDTKTVSLITGFRYGSITKIDDGMTIRV